MEKFIEKLQRIMDEGGSYCIHCGQFFKTVIDCRKHILGKHYEYALAQHRGDKKLLLEWVKGV